MRTTLILAVAALAPAAAAQTEPPVLTRIQMQVRPYDAFSDQGWTSVLDTLPGTRIEVRAVVSYLGTEVVGGLGQVVFQPVISGWQQSGSTLVTNSILALPGPANGIGPIGGTRSVPIGIVDNLPGAYGRITPFGANTTTTSTYLRGHFGTGTASGMLRIAQAHITNWIGEGATSGPLANNNINGGGGVSIAQIPNPLRNATDPAFETRRTNLVVFKFAFILGPSFDVMNITPGSVNQTYDPILERYTPNIRWFASDNESSPSIRSGAELLGAQIVVPAPGAAVLLACGVFACRRRVR